MITGALMNAMVLEQPGQPLVAKKLPVPAPDNRELLLKVLACGICRTDLHVVDGELKEPSLPLIPGHQIIGLVEDTGRSVKGFHPGDAAGVPWLGGACGSCSYCLSGRENLCDRPVFTGYQRNGGFAEYCTANAEFCLHLTRNYAASQAAPLLCAGLIGYRSLRMAGNGKRLGIYGFGAAAHIITQVAAWQGREVYAFTRSGDLERQAFARSMGACWAGSSMEPPPVKLDAAIIFAPDGALVPRALRALAKGGVVVCGGIHMSPVPGFEYSLLWGERSIVSVANLTRRDGEEFLALAPQVPVRTEVELFPLEAANEALSALRAGRIRGAGVLVP